MNYITSEGYIEAVGPVDRAILDAAWQWIIENKSGNAITLTEKCPHTFNFLQHVFGKHIMVGLDYLSKIYGYKDIYDLPILILSGARQSGKTMFLIFIEMLCSSTCAAVVDLGDIFPVVTKKHSGRRVFLVEEVDANDNIFKALLTSATFLYENKDGISAAPQRHATIVSSNCPITRGRSNCWHLQLEAVQPDLNLLRRLREEMPAFKEFIAERKAICKDIRATIDAELRSSTDKNN